MYILFLFVTFCSSYYDMSFVQFYLDSEFLLNLVVTPMLGKWKGQAKHVTRKSTRNTCNITRNTTSNTQLAGFLGDL